MLVNLFKLALVASLSFQPVFAKSIRVMSYNVENLFDTEHDEGKNDWTFVPLSNPNKIAECEKVTVSYYKKECLETDWTPEKLQIKLGQIVKVVKSEGALPDVLVLVEVENNKVVDMLRKQLGFQYYVMTNSPDERGIDVAVLYNTNANLKFINANEYVIKESAAGIPYPTRNVLEVNFDINGTQFSLFANHWPSQQNSPATRISVANQVLEMVKNKLASPNTKVMLAGDFNVADNESPNPIYDVLANDGTGLNDIYKKLTESEKSKLPPGTFFYGWDFAWNRLDKIIVSSNFLSGSPVVNPSSFNIVHPDFITRNFVQKNPARPHAGESVVVPWKYWPNATSADNSGFSDHYPVEISINF